MMISKSQQHILLNKQRRRLHMLIHLVNILQQNFQTTRCFLPVFSSSYHPPTIRIELNVTKGSDAWVCIDFLDIHWQMWLLISLSGIHPQNRVCHQFPAATALNFGPFPTAENLKRYVVII